jgi:RimJ/RimL family protein N-acetyltransferase
MEYQHILLNPSQLLAWSINNRNLKEQIEKMMTTYRGHYFSILNFLFEAKENKDKMRFLFVINEDEEEVVGLCRITDEGHNIQYISAVVMNPKYRGKGLCSKMINFLIRKTKKKGTKYRLEVDIDNEPAIKCYLKSGFRIVKKIRMNTRWNINLCYQ